MTKTFKTPFAAQGDRVSIPNEVQPDGSVSYTQGYGYDYERDQNTDPAAKDIEREKMNGMFHDITEAVGEIQTFGAAQWTIEAQPYPLRALVYHNQKLYQSRIENNKEDPQAGKGWVELKADLTAADVGAYNQEETNQRFQPLGNYTSAGYSYGKEESDNRFQPKGNYQPVGNYALKGDSYIKSESDGKYQPKGNYLEAGYSYSKGESDDKYQSRGNYQPAGNYQPTGNYASAASQTFTGEVRAPNIITGAVNNQSFFFQRDGVWTWTVQQNGSWRGEIGHPGRGGVFSLQGDSYTKGESDGKYQPRGNYQHAGNYQPAGNYAVRGECYTRGESDSRYSKIDRNSMQRFAWPNNGQNPMNFGRNCSGKLCVIEFSHEGAQTITFIIPNQNFGFMHVTCGGAGELRFRINPNRIEKIQTWDRDVVAVYIEY